MRIQQTRPFTASTDKFAYAQAFTASSPVHPVHRSDRTLLTRLAARRQRARVTRAA